MKIREGDCPSIMFDSKEECEAFLRFYDFGRYIHDMLEDNQKTF